MHNGYADLECRALAMSGTPDVWRVSVGSESVEEAFKGNHGQRMCFVVGVATIDDFDSWGFTKASAEYIAAAHPSVILAMINEIRELRARVASVQGELLWH